MVQLEEQSTICTVRNKIENAEIQKISLAVRPSYSLAKLYGDISTQLGIGDFQLMLEVPTEESQTNQIQLNCDDKKTVEEAGLVFKSGCRNTLYVVPKTTMSTKQAATVDEDLITAPSTKKIILSTDKIEQNNVASSISQIVASSNDEILSTNESGTTTTKVTAKKLSSSSKITSSTKVSSSTKVTSSSSKISTKVSSTKLSSSKKVMSSDQQNNFSFTSATSVSAVAGENIAFAEKIVTSSAFSSSSIEKELTNGDVVTVSLKKPKTITKSVTKTSKSDVTDTEKTKIVNSTADTSTEHVITLPLKQTKPKFTATVSTDDDQITSQCSTITNGHEESFHLEQNSISPVDSLDSVNQDRPQTNSPEEDVTPQPSSIDISTPQESSPEISSRGILSSPEESSSAPDSRGRRTLPSFHHSVEQFDENADDDIALGASASPTEPEPTNYGTLAIYDVPLMSTNKKYGAGYTSIATSRPVSSDYQPTAGYSASTSRPTSGYVGLVNQAMTCYLNSLLQALFMTPDFRNALYGWKFDGDEPSKSIPFQLQKLFLNLQTSSRSAIETTDLTKSFGWDSSEAWQQHDVQELCRVMFDALEHKFKNTKQADLINRLYSGKMIDYVKCLECSTEKSREDTLLDIPLPVRPFGSNVAYESIEEALRAFVQPETLDENNQYFCEKCNKKCDAHKGLKFTKFPYILTLHLKRFDFDYQTLHRIKLNDKVTFPQILNLNSFVKESDTIGFVQATTNGQSASSEHGSVESAIKCDDCSTTDSGSALEEENGTNYASVNGNNMDNDLQEDDEGIDMSASTDNKSNTLSESGPYVYELFAIMIHSGSASGGHYYAYIKEFDNGEWYCFNDTTVSTASQEDIQRSFGGGGPLKTYYSGAYNASTNAYMLMYRQMDPNRNVAAIKTKEFPQHINDLLLDLRKHEEAERINKERQLDLMKIKVFFFNPKTQRMQDTRIYLSLTSNLKDALDDSYSLLKVENFAPIERCRLVAYYHNNEDVIRSYEGQEDQDLCKVLMKLDPLELLIQTRDANTEFEVLLPGGVSTKVYTVDIATGDVDGPTFIRGMLTGTVADYKKVLAAKLNLDASNIIVALQKYKNHASKLNFDRSTLKNEDVQNGSKVFVATSTTSSDEEFTKLTKIVERFEHIITLYFVLPETDKETLEKMSIPSYDPEASSPTSTRRNAPKYTKTTSNITTTSFDCVDAVMTAAPSANNYNNSLSLFIPIPPPQPTAAQLAVKLPKLVEPESNSEDSSLSDSDRTLVEDYPPDSLEDMNTTAFSDNRLSSPENLSQRINDFDFDDDACVTRVKPRTYYFKAVYFEEPVVGIEENTKPQKMLKVLVDTGMIMGNLKRALEPYVKVPKEFFKIFVISSNTETECTRLTESLKMFKDSERLVIELGRALRLGEFKCKISYLKLSEVTDDTEQFTFLCDWILRNGANVGQTKREIIAHLATIGHDIQYENCRLRRQLRRSPQEIYLDDLKFGDDYSISENCEVLLQVLEDVSMPYTKTTDKCLFIRRWNPSTMILDNFKEITITDNSELKNILSTVSGIPETNLEYAITSGTFPTYNVCVLNIHTSLNWCSSRVKCDDWPLSMAKPGDCFFFKDKEEQLKELTPAEQSKLRKERQRYSSSSYSNSTYSSPRRERALKIYLDPSPKKTDDGSTYDL